MQKMNDTETATVTFSIDGLYRNFTKTG